MLISQDSLYQVSYSASSLYDNRKILNQLLPEAKFGLARLSSFYLGIQDRSEGSVPSGNSIS